MIGWFGLLGCAPTPLSLSATADVAGVEVRANQAVDRIEVRDASGAPILRRTLPVPTHEVFLGTPLAIGESVQIVAARGANAATLAVSVGGRPAREAAGVARVGSVRIAAVQFPTDAFGVPEPARTSDRLELPGNWAFWVRAGGGWRARADQAPWAWSRVALSSSEGVPVDVAVTARVLDGRGAVPPVFRAWVRDAPRDEVSTVVRVPAGGTAVVALPLYVDVENVAPGTYVREISLRPMGGGPPIDRMRVPLAVHRSGRVLAAGIALAGFGVCSGWVLILLRWRAWFTRLSPGEALVVGLLGSLGHLAGAVIQLAGAGLASVLGPFAPFATGLADDVLRMCLLGTLLALVPRPGVAALAAIVGTTVRAVVLGSFHPLDVLALGATVGWLEAAVRVGGAAQAGWFDRRAAWWRLGTALVIANVALTATSLVFGAVGWRLYYSPGYVAALLLLPGAVYAAFGCALAVPFTASLRRVAP